LQGANGEKINDDKRREQRGKTGTAKKDRNNEEKPRSKIKETN
jgi:hypothetical protein